MSPVVTNLFFEPTDHNCSRKPFQTNNWQGVIKFITPNLSELQVIAKNFGADIPKGLETTQDLQEVARLAKYVASYIQHVIVTLGSNGLMIANKNKSSDSLMKAQNQGDIIVRHYPALKCCNVINVSGAGDCLAAGIITAMLDGKSEEECVNVGIHSSHCALRSQSAIPNKFELNENCYNEKANYVVL